MSELDAFSETAGGLPESTPPIEYFIQPDTCVALPDESLLDASRRMVFDLVPALVVREEGAVGVLTFRDVLFAATAGKDLSTTRVRDLMNGLCRTEVEVGTPLRDVMERCVHHLDIGVAVVEEGRFVGLVTFLSILKGLRTLRDSPPERGVE